MSPSASVAPSAAAASLWLRVSPFPPMPVVSAEPWRLEARRRRVWRGSMDAPVRVMVGGAPVGEGAAVIAALMERVGRLADYRFVAADAHQAGAGWADLVLVLPGGPEPFSRAALAALATGAELVTLRDRLHAAELAHGGRGVVLADAAALFAFFENLDAVAHVRARRAATSEAGAMRVGTTTAEVLS